MNKTDGASLANAAMKADLDREMRQFKRLVVATGILWLVILIAIQYFR